MRSLLLHAGNEEVLQDGRGWASYYHSAYSVHCATRSVAGMDDRALWASFEGTFCVVLLAQDGAGRGLCCWTLLA